MRRAVSLKAPTPARRFAAAAFAHLPVTAALLVATPGCVVDVRVPDDADITCDDDGACPIGFVCRTRVGRCVLTDSETDPPGVIDGSLDLSPASRAVGPQSPLEVRFSATEPLGVPAVLRLDAPGGAIGIDRISAAIDEPAFLWVPPVGTPEGTHPLITELVDRLGNAGDVGLGTVTVDFTPPGLAATPRVAPSLASLNTPLLLTLVVDEAVDGPPAVELVAPDGDDVRAMELTSDESPWTYRYDATGDEVQGASWSTWIFLRDLAGNVASPTPSAGSVAFDFVAPTLDGEPLIDLDAPDEFPLEVVRDATDGTKIEIELTLSEDVSAPPELFLVEAGLELAPLTASLRVFGFEWEVGAAAPEGVLHLRAVGVDDAGNPYDLEVGEVTVDRSAPPAPSADLDDGLVYRRAPWGSEDGPATFSLAVDPLATPDATHLQVWDDDLVVELGLIELEPASAVYELLPLDAPTVVVVSIDDAGNASAPTRVRQIEWTATLREKTANSTVGNPHRFETRRRMGTTLLAPDAAEAGASDGVGAVDGIVVATGGAGSWRRFEATAALPSGRKDHAVAWDNRRGRLVLFGGLTHPGTNCAGSGFNYCGDTWEFDGRRWTSIVPVDTEGDGQPSARFGHSMTYDGSRGELLLFGGKDASGNCEGSGNNWCPVTWVFDGASWVQREDGAVAPSPRNEHAAVYDVERGVVVLFGGIPSPGGCAPHARCNDTWEWDGESWTELPIDEAARPSPRGGHAMGWDDARRRVVLFGGRWDNASADEECTPRTGPFCQDVWELEDGEWQEIEPVGVRPAAREGHTLTFEPSVEALVVYGGAGVGDCEDYFLKACADPWTWDGTTFTELSELAFTGDEIWPREGHAAASVPGRGPLIFGGDLDLGGAPVPCPDGLAVQSGRCRLADTWQLSARWRGLSPTDPEGDGEPPARATAAMAGGPLSTWLIGGVDAAGCVAPGDPGCLADTWRWTGRSWRFGGDEPLVEGPGALVATGPDGLLRFGDLRVQTCGSGTGDCDSVASFAGTAWTEVELVAPTPHPAGSEARTAYALTWDAARDEVVLHGGLRPGLSAGAPCPDGETFADGAGRCASPQTWRYQAGVWTLASSGGPSARSGAAMAADEKAGVVVLYGGIRCVGVDPESSPCDSGDEIELLDDTWVWDGASWTLADDAGPLARFEHTLTWDPGRERVVLFGGRAAPLTDCGTGSRFCRDTWEWDGTAWRLQEPADPEGDGNPNERRSHVAAPDRVRGNVILFGGDGGLDDTWIWQGGADARPGHVLHVDARAAESVLEPGVEVERLWASWTAGATGSNAAGAPLSGVELSLYLGGHWQSVAENEAPVQSPAALAWEWTDAEQLGRAVLDDPERTLHLAAAARGATGTGASRAIVATDGVEVTLRYRLPPP